ncbi:MAG: DoxX family membrane protein [Bacteroidetes bacterium]|nr:DoxX family membrane protein [Bacteroidota bacterium]
MRNPLKYIGKDAIASIIRIIFGAVFVLSGSLKLFDLSGFIKSITSFELLPTYLIPIFSYSLPFLELILGFCLIFNYKSFIISNILTYIVAAFTAVVN